MHIYRGRPQNVNVACRAVIDVGLSLFRRTRVFGARRWRRNEVWHRLRIAQAAIYEKFLVARAQVDRLPNDVANGALAGKEAREENQFIRLAHPGKDVRKVWRRARRLV